MSSICEMKYEADGHFLPMQHCTMSKLDQNNINCSTIKQSQRAGTKMCEQSKQLQRVQIMIKPYLLLGYIRTQNSFDGYPKA